MAQAVKDDVREHRVSILPFLEFLPNQDRFNCQTVRQAQEHPAVAVSAIHVSLIHFQMLEPVLQFFFQSFRHENRAAGRCRFGLFQNQNRVAALALVLELPENAVFPCSGK